MTGQLVLHVREDQPLREAVYEAIRRGILLGNLSPDERLMEMHLAKDLGVSRTPVREALRLLEADGLVEVIPNKGAVVARISLRDLLEVMEVRLALEHLAVRKACGSITLLQLNQMRSALNRFRVSLEKNDRAESARSDEEFHRIIDDAAQNRILSALLTQIREQVFRYRIESLKAEDTHRELVRQHEEILEALEKRDEERAQACMEEHIRMQLENIRKLLEDPE